MNKINLKKAKTYNINQSFAKKEAPINLMDKFCDRPNAKWNNHLSALKESKQWRAANQRLPKKSTLKTSIKQVKKAEMNNR